MRAKMLLVVGLGRSSVGWRWPISTWSRSAKCSSRVGTPAPPRNTSSSSTGMRGSRRGGAVQDRRLRRRRRDAGEITLNREELQGQQAAFLIATEAALDLFDAGAPEELTVALPASGQVCFEHGASPTRSFTASPGGRRRPGSPARRDHPDGGEGAVPRVQYRRVSGRDADARRGQSRCAGRRRGG